VAGRGRGLGGEEGAWSVAGRGRAGRWRGRLAMMSAHQHQHCVSAMKAKNCTTRKVTACLKCLCTVTNISKVLRVSLDKLHFTKLNQRLSSGLSVLSL
jgi:hypothetical protein